jgi:8-oxo-dGTP diphosphatase
LKTSAWVAVACPTSGRVILAKRSRATNHAGQWNFFGGGVDRGERPEHAACRELREESGLLAKPSYLLPLGEAIAGDKRHLLFGLVLAREIAPRLNKESEEFRWLRPADIDAGIVLHSSAEQLMPRVDGWLKHLAPRPDIVVEAVIAPPAEPPATEEPPAPKPAKPYATWLALRRMLGGTPGRDVNER